MMMRVVALMAAENRRPRILRMSEPAMRTLPAGHQQKSRPFQVGDQLSNLPWHMRKTATKSAGLPITSLLLRLSAATPTNIGHPSRAFAIGEDVRRAIHEHGRFEFEKTEIRRHP